MYPARQNIQRKLWVFFNCLLLSSVLWILTTMNQLHTDIVQFPVEYVGIPANMIPINKLPENIQIKIQASGYRLMMNRLQKTWAGKTLIINLGIDITSTNKNLLAISLQSKRHEISEQLGKQVTVLSIEPDSLRMQFDLKATRKVPVAVKTELKFAKGYGQSGPMKIQPDSITIVGKDEEINQTDSVFTFTLSESQVNKSIHRVIGIDLPGSIQSKQTEVTVNIPVEQVSEKQLTCSIEIIQTNTSPKIQLLQSQVTLKIKVPNSLYHQISANDFKLGVYSQDASPTLSKLIVRVLHKPSNVEILDIDPPAVEYLMKSM